MFICNLAHLLLYMCIIPWNSRLMYAYIFKPGARTGDKALIGRLFTCVTVIISA